MRRSARKIWWPEDGVHRDEERAARDDDHRVAPAAGVVRRNLDGRTFLGAFATDPVYREQYGDAVAALVADQLRAGLDVLSDGEMRFDQDIGGRSWSGTSSTASPACARSEAGAEADGTRSPAQSPGRGGADIFREIDPAPLRGRRSARCRRAAVRRGLEDGAAR